MFKQMKVRVNGHGRAGLYGTVLGALLGACATPAPTLAPTETDLVWPPAPAAARIRYLFSVHEARDILGEKGWGRKAFDFLSGRQEHVINSPYGVAVDDGGRLYVVDAAQRAVHLFDTAGGRHYLFPDEPVEGFENPLGIALGSEGRIYVTDVGSNRVHVFSQRGKTYERSFGQDELQRPTSLALNQRTGELLVLDTPASRLAVYDERQLTLKRYMGMEGESEGGFHLPTSVAVAGDGTVYVSDSLNYRVQALDAELGFKAAFGAAGDGPGHFARPKGVAVDSEGHVYVVDALFDNVQIFDSAGRLLLVFGGPGSGRGEFWLPNALFIDRQDRIYVSDAANRRVQVFQYLKNETEKESRQP